jgi:hypothetical protein
VIHKFGRKHLLLLTLIVGITIFSAVPASAHVLETANGTMNCGGFCLNLFADQLTPGASDVIRYNIVLTSTTGGPTVTATGEFDFVVDDSGTKNISDCLQWPTPGGNLTDSYIVTFAQATVHTTDSENESTLDINFNGTTSLICGPPPEGKSFKIGPSSMEGALTIRPGDWISGGYNFKFTSASHPATAVTVTATVTVPVVCSDSSVENVVIPLGTPGALNGNGATTYTYNIPAGDTKNHASNDQNSILVWEGAVQAPANLCGGNGGKNNHGAIFNATVSQNPKGSLTSWQFHYRDPNAKGKGNVNCTDATDPRRARADVCGASWSQTVVDP